MALIPQHNTLGLGRIEKCDRERRGQPFCQLVERNDITRFQIPKESCAVYVYGPRNTNSEIASSGELATYGQFDPGGKAEWTYSAGKAVTVGDSKSFYVPASIYTYPIGSDAQLDISVTLCPGVTMEVVFFSGAAPTDPPTQVLLEVISASGTYTYRHTSAYTTGSFAVRVIGACTESLTSGIEYFRLQNILSSECSYPVIKDIDGNNVAEIYDYDLSDDNLSISWIIDWANLGLSDGCYTICIENTLYVTNLFTLADNGTFEDNYNGITSGVTTHGVTSIISYEGIKSWKAVYNTAGSTSLLQTTAINLEYRKRYRISARVYIDVASYQVQDAFIAFAQPMFTDAIGTTIAEPVTGREWVEIYLEFSPNYYLNTSFTFQIYASGSDWNTSDTTIYIDDIKLYDLDAVGSHCSECVILKETHPCTYLLEWWNDNDAYGYKYDDGDFKHSMRIEGSLTKVNYSGEKDVYKDTTGQSKIVYADKEKHFELAIRDMPEYMHDALAIGIDHDNFTIDGTAYIIEESGYEPQWRKTSDLAPVILDVKPKTQNLTNSYC